MDKSSHYYGGRLVLPLVRYSTPLYVYYDVPRTMTETNMKSQKQYQAKYLRKKHKEGWKQWSAGVLPLAVIQALKQYKKELMEAYRIEQMKKEIKAYETQNR